MLAENREDANAEHEKYLLTLGGTCACLGLNSLVRALVDTEHACVLAALKHRSINRIRLRIEISFNGLKTL